MRLNDDAPQRDHTGRLRSEGLLAALVCLLFAIAFARTPIAHLSDAVWSPADASQVMSLTRVTDGWHPRNELLSDVWLQMQSWLQFQRDELHQGRMPLWNPWDGNGEPQLANYQAAALSPFSVPYYVLPFALAVVIASVAKLFCLSFFTFLFLRELRLAFSASMLGAIVFAYAGHNVVLIGHPHSSVAALIPAALFLVERIVRRTAADASLARTAPAAGGARATWRALAPGAFAGLVAVLVMLQLAGHPETLFFALGFVGVYAAFRLAAAWRDARGLPRARRRVLVLAGQLVACGLCAALIGTLQTLPFFEYLRSSAMLEHRTGRQIPLGLRTWSTLLFPNLLGNPSTSYYVLPTLPRPDFTIATMAYVGGTATLAALSAFLFATRRRACAFFAGAFALWFVYAYDVGGSGALWDRIPGLSLAPINRSQPIGAFCVACLAAFAVDAALRRGRNVRTAAFVAVLGTVGLVLARRNAHDVVELVRAYLPDEAKRRMLLSGSAEHVASMSWLLVAGIVVLALLWVVPRGWMRVSAVWAVALLAYAQTGALLKGYMPLCDDVHFFPVTPAIQQWRASAKNREVLVLGDDTIPPGSNMVYGLPQAASYDALGIRRYERLYCAQFGPFNNWMLAQRASVHGLQLFGIGAVLDHDGWLDVDTAFASVDLGPQSVTPAGELVRGAEVVQDLTGVRDGLDSLRVRFERPPDGVSTTVDVTLEDATSGTVLAHASVAAASLDDEAEDAVAVTLRFAPIAGSRTQLMRLHVRSPDGERGRALVLRARNDGGKHVHEAIASLRPDDGKSDSLAAAWKLSRDGQGIAGELDLDLGFADHELHAEAQVGRFTLYGFDRATSRFHTVGTERWAKDEADAWHLVDAPGFDPVREVVLEPESDRLAESPATSSGPRAVSIVADVPGHTVLHVEAGADRWLVLTQPWYPGWRARVGGGERRIWRANYAFSAVELPAHACDVDLDYEPMSFRIACWLALSASVALSGWLGLSRLRRVVPQA